MGRHSVRGVLTGEELNVAGHGSLTRQGRHTAPGSTVCMRHKDFDGKLWRFWPTDFRPSRVVQFSRQSSDMENVVSLQDRRNA